MEAHRARVVFANDRFRVVVLEHVAMNVHRTARSCQVHGSFKPVSVVVLGPDSDEVQAWALDGKLEFETLGEFEPLGNFDTLGEL